MKIDKQKVEEWKKQHGEIFQIETKAKAVLSASQHARNTAMCQW